MCIDTSPLPERLVLEEESPVLYHNAHNSRVYHEKDRQGMTINPEVGKEAVLQARPFVSHHALKVIGTAGQKGSGHR